MMSNVRDDGGFRESLTVVAICVLLQACSPAAPELTPQLSAALQAEAFAIACQDVGCRGSPVYSWDTTPSDVRAAIAAVHGGEVTYLNGEQLDNLLDDRGLYADGGISIAVFEARLLRADVVGVDVFSGHGSFDVVGRTVLFHWNGSEWLEATPDEVGVTVTSAVS